MSVLAKPYRLYAVTIHDATTRELCVPEYEIGVIKAAWRGVKVTTAPTNDVREVITDPAQAYRSLLNRYSKKHVEAFFPGPERLEGDMLAAAEKTAAWLVEKKKIEEAEVDRARKQIRDSTPKTTEQKAK